MLCLNSTPDIDRVFYKKISNRACGSCEHEHKYGTLTLEAWQKLFMVIR